MGILHSLVGGLGTGLKTLVGEGVSSIFGGDNPFRGGGVKGTLYSSAVGMPGYQAESLRAQGLDRPRFGTGEIGSSDLEQTGTPMANLASITGSQQSPTGLGMVSQQNPAMALDGPPVASSGGEGSIPAFALAQQYLGKTEGSDYQTLGSFFKKAGGQNIDPRNTPWCAAFVNSVLGSSGSKGTGSLAARSFLNWGQAVDRPTEGDVVVFSRGNPKAGTGHVGFYAGEEVRNGQTYIKVLGGNQSNSVSYSYYPKSRLLGIRRPVSGSM